MKRRILEYIHISVETEVLRIIRGEEYMIARITFHLNGIHDVITIETDGIVSNRRCHSTAKKSDAIIIYIYLRERICRKGIKDITCLEYLIDTFRTLTYHKSSLFLRILAIHHLRHLLVKHEREDELTAQRTIFHLIPQPRSTAYKT